MRRKDDGVKLLALTGAPADPGALPSGRRSGAHDRAAQAHIRELCRQAPPPQPELRQGDSRTPSGDAQRVGKRCTCQDFLHVCAAPVLHDAPDRALEEVQQVVIGPEVHEHDNRELHDLQAGQPSASMTVLCAPTSPCHRQDSIKPCYMLGVGLQRCTS